MSDADLAALALAGEPPAWDEIVRRHSRRVVVALLAQGVALDHAEDLAQEAWLRLVQQQRAGRLRTLELPGLAIAQAGWLARESTRSRIRREAIAGRPLPLGADAGDVEDTDPNANPEGQAILCERWDVVRDALARCPPRAQQVFSAVYGPGAPSHAQVAHDLGLSVQRVRHILCEVRARIRIALNEMERGDES